MTRRLAVLFLALAALTLAVPAARADDPVNISGGRCTACAYDRVPPPVAPDPRPDPRGFFEGR